MGTLGQRVLMNSIISFTAWFAGAKTALFPRHSWSEFLRSKLPRPSNWSETKIAAAAQLRTIVNNVYNQITTTNILNKFRKIFLVRIFLAEWCNPWNECMNDCVSNCFQVDMLSTVQSYWRNSTDCVSSRLPFANDQRTSTGAYYALVV